MSDSTPNSPQEFFENLPTEKAIEISKWQIPRLVADVVNMADKYDDETPIEDLKAKDLKAIALLLTKFVEALQGCWKTIATMQEIIDKQQKTIERLKRGR